MANKSGNIDKDKGEEIKDNSIKADRYELEKEKFVFKKTYTYDNSRKDLIYEIDNEISKNSAGFILGNYSYMSSGYSINLTNKI